MWFEPSTDQKALLGPLRDFLKAEVAPGASERDQTGRFPLEIVGRLGALGVMGMQVPEAYGGAGLDSASSARIIEEIAVVDGSLCLAVASHNALCTGHILLAGTDGQKKTYLPQLASAERLGAWGLTEPGAGSDAGGLKSRAEDRGDRFVLNGSKMFITQGTVAGLYVLMVRTDPPAEGQPKTDGISAFIVEAGSDGLVPGRPEAKLGLHSSDTASLTMENLSVPAKNLLGERGKAFRDVMEVLNGGRIGIAAMGVGLGRGAFDVAARYALEREQFGKPIAQHQAIGFKLADMATELEAARLLYLKAAALRDAGRPYSLAASQAKLKGSTAGVQACDEAIQILGGYGYMSDYQVERMWRDARLTRIGEGTDEIQRLVIAREVLGAYRS